MKMNAAKINITTIILILIELNVFWNVCDTTVVATVKNNDITSIGTKTNIKNLNFSSNSIFNSGSSSSTGTAISEKPYFDDVNSRNVTSLVDETVILNCTVKNKGNRTVSWIRKRDLHILTSDVYTYTGDQRFSVIHPVDSADWNLKIEYAQQHDSGIYECQVNTEPKINFAIFLEVTDPEVIQQRMYSIANTINGKVARAKIMGSQEIHVKKGSTISLSCAVNVQVQSIQWYHGAHLVDFDSQRGGISLETEKTEGGTTSRLMLTRAQFRDSGNYTCAPHNAISASAMVHVLNGEHPAAMQTSSAVPCPSHAVLLLLCILCNNYHLSKFISCLLSLSSAPTNR